MTMPEKEHTMTIPEKAVEPLTIIYTNWRGETAERRIMPTSIWYGSTDWHPEPQWLVKAIDIEKNAERDFAWSGIDFQGNGPALAAALPHLGEPVAWRQFRNGAWLYYDNRPVGDFEPLYAAPHPAPATLGEVMADAKARFAVLTPEQQEAEMRAQRESWVRGEAAMGSDADEAREREALRGLNQVPAGQKLTLGEMAGILRASGFVVLDQAAEARLAAADPVSDPRVRAVVEALRQTLPLFGGYATPSQSLLNKINAALRALPNQSEAK